MVIQIFQRARCSYVEISNFLRSSRVAPLHVGRQTFRNLIQPRLVDPTRRRIHQARSLRSEREDREGVPEIFEKYMDSCMSPFYNILSMARVK